MNIEMLRAPARVLDDLGCRLRIADLEQKLGDPERITMSSTVSTAFIFARSTF